MIDAVRAYSVEQQQLSQRRLNAVATALLLFGVLAVGGLLAVGRSPSQPLLFCFVGLLIVGVLWRQPVLAVYLLVFAALFIEQYGIAGLNPLTARTPIYAPLSRSLPLPIPVTPVELILVLALAAVALPRLAEHEAAFYKGSLFGPIVLFLAAILAACAYGFVAGPAGTVFNPDAAWDEVRGFSYLIAMYFLAGNLITDRKRLITLVWIIILALGFKGVQGIDNFVTAQRRGLQLEALTGHEDVLFFATFFLLLAAMHLYGGHQRQRRIMYWFLLPVTFTELATGRRIAFFVLAVGFVVLGLALFKTRRSLFFKIVPAVIVLLLVYGALFWNSTTILGEPTRAFKSQIGYTNERDRRSDQWRDLEAINIAYNIRSAPLTGLGVGRPYRFVVEQPTLGGTPAEGQGFYWTYITHDAIFWVWMKMGLFGFIAFWFLFGSAIVQGLVTFRQLSDGYLQVLALVIVGLVAMQITFSYGDLGLTGARTMIYLGCMLGVLVRLPTLDREPASVQPDSSVTDRGMDHGRTGPSAR